MTQIKIIILLLVSLCISFSMVEAEGSHDFLSTDFTLMDVKPTLTGHENKAFVNTEKVGKDNKEMTVFWTKDEPEYKLAAQQGGLVWGNNSGFEIGHRGEKIFSGNSYVAVDGETQFFGNLDYEGSIYMFIGKVHLAGYTFDGDVKNPLTFKLVKNSGFSYVSGSGSITTKDGAVHNMKNGAISDPAIEKLKKMYGL